MLNKSNLIDRIRLPFRKEKGLFSAIYELTGFYPRNIEYYKLSLMHKSVSHRNANGRPLNNERLEFLGDAVLDAVVGDIVYRRFEGKREGFLTNTRSKLVQRDTLNRLAQEIGLMQLIKSSDHSTSHNSYMGGNAFEALVGAIYLDRGYDACMDFMQKRILKQLINIDKVAYKEVNFKSKLLEWTQKNRVRMEYRAVRQSRDESGSPIFEYAVIIEGIECCRGKGYSKKESQQLASKDTLQRLRREPQFIDEIFDAKAKRTKMEEEPVQVVPDLEQPEDFITHRPETVVTPGMGDENPKEETVVARDDKDAGDAKAAETSPEADGVGESDEFSLDDIKAIQVEKSREDIIAEAEAAAFADLKMEG